MYTSDIFVGNPPQKLRALFDTGSQHTWILSKKSQMKKEERDMFHYYYDEEKSSTARKFGNGKQSVAVYGSGNLTGHFITDDFRVGVKQNYNINGLAHVNNDTQLKEQNELLIPNF
jgi:hypothetical protein